MEQTAGIAERLEKYTIRDPNSGCWLWIGSTDTAGYGMLTVDHRALKCHRLSYEEHIGPIPVGMCVLHKCDTPACIRPDHLFLGTHKDNAVDRQRKGRTRGLERIGEQHHKAVLTEELVRYIRQSPKTAKALAEELGCTTSPVWQARVGKTWKHVTC